MHDRDWDNQDEGLKSPEHKRRNSSDHSNCKNKNPEDFEYVKEIVNERLPKGVASSSVVIPEDWEEERKERVVQVIYSSLLTKKSNLLSELGFERLARDPFRFKVSANQISISNFQAPKKKALLSPLKMILSESEDELVSSFTTLKLGSNHAAAHSSTHRHGKKRKDSDAHDETHLHTRTPFKITAIQIGGSFSLEKDENTELEVIIDYKDEVIIFDVCEFVTKKRIEVLFSNIKTVERDFGTCLSFVIKDVSTLEYYKETPNKEWEKIQDFTEGALASFPFIKVQFAIKKTFDKHWTHLQHILRNTDLENHITKFYKLTTLIGRGSFSEIRLGIHIEEKKEYAIKIVDKKHLQSDMLKQVRDEYELVRQLRHKNIIEMKESYETDDTLYIVMEYCKGGDLFDYINDKKEGNFTEEESRIIMKQLLSAIEYLHQHHYIHRDIKLENVVLTDPSTLSIKLIDFGIAKIMKRKTTRTFVGTPLYLETNLGHTDGYTDACDLWACGVILYILISGTPPFDTDCKHPSLPKQIKHGSYSLSGNAWKSVSEECKDLLKSLLCVPVKERITASKALKHDWFKIDL